MADRSTKNSTQSAAHAPNFVPTGSTEHTGAYPKPGPAGGAILRRMIALLRENAEKTGQIAEFPIPPGIPVGVAVSGGADSSALLLLLSKYGRRIVSDPQAQLTVLHYNHRWRGEASDQDAAHVRDLVARLGLRFLQEEAPSPAGDTAAATAPNEDLARSQRKAFFSRFLANHPGAWIFTAHHANDLAETVLWRLLTGAPAHQEGGILPCSISYRELRPLLTTPKTDLISFLSEEGGPWGEWREDATNTDGRLLRSALRVKVVPELDRLFPRWVETLGERAAEKWRSGAGDPLRQELKID